MALVIVDGYNAVFGLRTTRERLVEKLRRMRGGDAVWVVFDSRRGEDTYHYWAGRGEYGVKIVFADGSFDDWVAQQAGAGEFEHDTVVVTNDWDLRLRLSGRVICRGLDDYFGKRRGV